MLVVKIFYYITTFNIRQCHFSNIYCKNWITTVVNSTLPSPNSQPREFKVLAFKNFAGYTYFSLKKIWYHLFLFFIFNLKLASFWVKVKLPNPLGDNWMTQSITVVIQGCVESLWEPQGVRLAWCDILFCQHSFSQTFEVFPYLLGLVFDNKC